MEHLSIEKRLLTPNEYSRPERQITVKGLVYHWTNNPGQDESGVWTYFERDLPQLHKYGSAHFIIGPTGKIIECIPLDEMAYHVGSTRYIEPTLDYFITRYPNDCLLGIELCHPDESGEFAQGTLDSAIYLGAALCMEYTLDPLNDIVRHFDVTGKDCPHSFAENLEAWRRFKELIDEELNRLLV